MAAPEAIAPGGTPGSLSKTKETNNNKSASGKLSVWSLGPRVFCVWSYRTFCAFNCPTASAVHRFQSQLVPKQADGLHSTHTRGLVVSKLRDAAARARLLLGRTPTNSRCADLLLPL